MIKVVLKDIVEKPITGEWGTEGGTVKILRTTNFTNNGYINYENVVLRDIEQKKVDSKRLLKGDLIIEKSGGSPTQPVGRVVYFDSDEIFLCNNFTAILRPKKEQVFPKYLHYILFVGHQFGLTSAFQNKTTGIINLQLVKYLEKLQIPLPPLPTQQKIASILDAADTLRQKDKALLAKYDELTQSLFLDMFGDPVSNPKGFEISTVGIQCTVKGGKRIPKDEKLVSVNTGFPYIKAGNIKYGHVTSKNLEYLLPKTREKLKRYTVEKGDICITVVGANIGDIGLVPYELHLANLTENANKILIKDKTILHNFYLAKYLQMEFVQKNIGAKTMAVGVPKLALFRIEQIELLIPPIIVQYDYAERVTIIEQQKTIAQASLEKSEVLFNSLLQKAFKGELV